MKILIFSPFQAIWKHATMENRLALSLIRGGNELTFLGCEGLLSSYCISMSAAGLTEESSIELKNKVCESCIKNSKISTSILKTDRNTLEAFLTRSDFDDIQRTLTRVNLENWLEFEYRGVNVGRIASYEFFIHRKMIALELASEDWPLLKMEIANSMKVIASANKFFDSNNFDAVICYNSLYSIHSSFCAVAKQRGIPSYSLQALGPISKQYSSAGFTSSVDYLVNLSRAKEWGLWAEQPITSRDKQIILDHFTGLFSAQSPFVYSVPARNRNPFEILTKLAIKQGRKIVVAALTSEDEMFAARISNEHLSPDANFDLFQSQSAWIKFLISDIGTRPDMHLVIRPHPREFPNKRDQLESAQAKMWREILTNLPQNISVNWPEDNISMYDLIPITDLLLTSVSNVGVELAAFGVPVVSYKGSGLNTYPPEINFIANSLEEYKELISKDILQEAKNEKIELAQKWVAFRYGHFVNSLGGALEIPESKIFRALRRAVVRNNVPIPMALLRFVYRLTYFDRANTPSGFEVVLRDGLNGLHQLPMEKLVEIETSPPQSASESKNALIELWELLEGPKRQSKTKIGHFRHK